MNINSRLRSPFASPPERKLEEKPAPSVEKADLAEAEPREKDGFEFKKVAMQFGLAMNSLAGMTGTAHAAAQVQEQVFTHKDISQAIDLAVDRSEGREEFIRRNFTSSDVLESLNHFSEQGGLTRTRRRGQSTTPVSEAAQRLRDGKKVEIRLPDGIDHVLRSVDDLQALDTFSGLGLKPVAAPEVVEALRGLEKGLDSDDGLVKDGSALIPERKISAYEAYKLLINEERGRAADAGFKGGLIGAGVALGVGAAVVGANALAPGLVPALAGGVAGLSGGVIAVAGGAMALSTVGGATIGYVGYKNENPDYLEVRFGQDSGMRIRSTEHASETYSWLQARRANPFTESQQRDALEALDEASGLYRGRREIDAEEALQRLRDGKEVRVPSSVPGVSDTLDNFRDLQILDTIKGTAANPVLTEDMSRSLRVLESGRHEADGFYGDLGSIKAGGQMTALDAVESLFWDRESIGISRNNHGYTAQSLTNVQELNALKGDGINTILPEGQFQSLQLFDRNNLMETASMTEDLDSYEALQAMHSGEGVRVASRKRKALAFEPEDLRELRAFEFSQGNDILESRQFDLLNYWDHNGGYSVDRDGQTDHAYEALQALQRGDQFDIRSEGRQAPASSYQDLQDLATFEAPQAGFPNTVPAEDFDRLTYFQGAREAEGLNTTRVGSREGRAYEGYRELRDGDHFSVNAGGVWNSVTSSRALHDLDALLGRGVNDILPQDQYDLLKLLADAPVREGLSLNGNRLNSYASLQQFRSGGGLTYDFNGGDFGDRLKIDTPNLESLDDSLKLLQDQREYDRYSYTVGEWQDKMQRQAAHTPELARDNLRYGQDELRDGEHKLSRGQSDLRRGQSDLSDAESDLRRAQWDLTAAYSMPSTTTEYRTECDDSGCDRVPYESHNYQRDWAISRAHSDISRARSDISDAERDISRARSLISEAESDISRAHGLIREAESLIGVLGGYQDTLSRVSDANYSETLARIQATLAQMKSLSNISSLTRNLNRQGQLIDNMSRPTRPEGYVVPERLVQS